MIESRTQENSDGGGGFRAAIGVVLAAAAVQLAIGALGPLDGDETLYWEWARHLAWGYYDHPPGIALLIRLGVDLFSVTALGVRFFATLANLGAALIVITLARRHGGERAALRAALILSCLPILANWLMLATPDSPLFFASVAVLLLVDNALQQRTGSAASLGWWLLAGIALGLAALSKELAILLPLGIVVAFTTHKELRPRLAEAGPWLAAAVSGMMIVPLIVWNRDHGWVLLQFILHRGLGAEHGGAVGRELEYVGGQAAIASPLLFVLMGGAVARTLRAPRDPRRHLLAMFALVAFGWFAVAALRHQVELNWAMLAYPPAAVLLAVETGREMSRRWLTAGLALGGAIVLVLDLHTAIGILPLSPIRDPIRRGHGWAEVAARVDAARNAGSAPATWIAGNRFQDASQLAFHLGGHPFVFSLNIHSRANQYDFWPRFAQQAKPGDRLILVLDDSIENSVARELAPFFTSTQAGERVAAGGAQPVLQPKRIWVLDGWLGGWPP